MIKKKAVKKSNKQASSSDDIIKLILDDHKPLKKLIKVMKNDDKDIEERRKAFEDFAPLLIAHAKPEEQALYAYMKEDDDLRVEGLEGDVEHAIADQLVHEAKNTDDEDLFSARIKVLAELVEHHIEEEEEEMLPNVRKNSEVEERSELGQRYLQLRMKYESNDRMSARNRSSDYRTQQ